MPPQNLAALARAEEHKVARAALMRQLHAGEIKLSQILAERPACILTMPVHELLVRMKWMGPTKVRDLNLTAARAGINLFRPVGELTDRQAGWLVRNVLPRGRGSHGLRPPTYDVIGERMRPSAAREAVAA